jgi:hypothetical protein
MRELLAGLEQRARERGRDVEPEERVEHRLRDRAGLAEPHRHDDAHDRLGVGRELASEERDVAVVVVLDQIGELEIILADQPPDLAQQRRQLRAVARRELQIDPQLRLRLGERRLDGRRPVRCAGLHHDQHPADRILGDPVGQAVRAVLRRVAARQLAAPADVLPPHDDLRAMALLRSVGPRDRAVHLVPALARPHALLLLC